MSDLDPYVWRTTRHWAFLDRKIQFDAVNPPWHDPRADDEVEFEPRLFVAPHMIRNPPPWSRFRHPQNWFRAI